MINATNTSTAPPSNPARMSVVVRTPATPREPAQSERTDRSSETRDVQLGHHHHAHRGRRRESAEPSGEAFATLKVKIQQTVSSLMDKRADAAAAAEPGAESDAPASGGVLQIKAKFEMSGPEGSIEARMKVRLDSGSAGVASGFAAVMQSFAETLYAALQTLYGGAQTSPPADAVTAPTAPSALPAPSPAAAAPASPAPASPPPTVASPVVSDAPAAADSKAAPAIASAVTPSAAGSDSVNASRSLTIKLRLTYDAFGSSLGTLVNELVRPDVGSDRPDVGPLLEDLAERFAQMMSLAPGAGDGAPSLNTFLTALSRSFFGAGGTASPTSALPAPAGNGPTDPAPATTAAPPAQAPAQRFMAMAEYRQVLSFGDVPAPLRSSLVYGFA